MDRVFLHIYILGISNTHIIPPRSGVPFPIGTDTFTFFSFYTEHAGDHIRIVIKYLSAFLSYLCCDNVKFYDIRKTVIRFRGHDWEAFFIIICS